MRKDFEQSKETVDILKKLKDYLTKQYGKRCITTTSGCITCIVWSHYDTFELELL